ncbi:MAG: hypothetical protein MK538_09360 [Planctomycetes bacterium]|nr:hypothetical protein [Planctomycetota bacterium]
MVKAFVGPIVQQLSDTGSDTVSSGKLFVDARMTVRSAAYVGSFCRYGSARTVFDHNALRIL